MTMHAHLLPSPWVGRFASLIPPGGLVLDVACGHGRHARFLAARGFRVEAVDHDAEALGTLTDVAGVTTRRADLENGPWPYDAECFDAIVVTNYLFRPRFNQLVAALKPNGVLIYETFMLGNERFGKPTNPDFLLRPDELLDALRPALNIVAFEQGRVDAPRPAMIQRVCATAGPVPALP